MNQTLFSKLFIYNSKIKNERNDLGFTLIELLVVVIIVGVLAAVALPNFLRQAGRARETEIMNTVGAFNRAQQAYHYERQEFAQGANDAEIAGKLGLRFDNKYIDAFAIVSDSAKSTIAPVNNEFDDDATRAYSGGIFVSSGDYSTIVCQSEEAAKELAPPTNSSSCVAGNVIK